jgi:inosine-uridine nucleoside N-ribohydrolase
MKVHLDTDLGGDLDDLCALALLLHWPGVEITGITTTAEDQGWRAGYTRYALALANRAEIPVRAGADVAGDYSRFQPGYPREADYWPVPIIRAPNAPDEALELLRQSLEQGATIIAIGPYTNLAWLDQKYPGILREARLFCMGGYVYPVRDGFPAWRNEDDFNIQFDARAAKHVLEHAHPTLIPVSVTAETALRQAYLPALRAAGPLGALIARQAEATNNDEQHEERYGRRYPNVPHDILNFQHDPLACAVALGWDGVTIEEIPLRFEFRDGWLHEVIAADGKPTPVVTQVDGARFNEFWLRMVSGVREAAPPHGGPPPARPT